MQFKRFFFKVLLLLVSHDFALALIYPASTNLGLTSSVSVPIAEFYPERRILIDWCFAVSYELPNNLTSFYTIPIWPGFANYQTKRELPHNEPSFYAKYGYNALTQTHPKDFSAGELYAAMEDSLSSYGFHDTCLLRSVCELAKHPFDGDHLLTDIITFVLSPSQHEGFLESEHVYRKAYEQAELDGFLGHDCARLYPDCMHDILRLVSKVIHI